jgi:glycerol-3-phosphate acyltransferase PlsY
MSWEFIQEHIQTLLLLCLWAYLLGSLPFAIWWGKTFHGVDVREHGSGNAGATNVFRTLGNRPGSIVLVLDVTKGYVAAASARLLLEKYNLGESDVSSAWIHLTLLLGAMAILGHLFPIFARFKGGKGVATVFGLLVALDVAVAASALGVFLLAAVIWRYVSLGSMLAALSLPFLFRLYLSYDFGVLDAFAWGIALVVIFMHRKNLNRLKAGTESKMKFLPKHRQEEA